MRAICYRWAPVRRAGVRQDATRRRHYRGGAVERDNRKPRGSYDGTPNARGQSFGGGATLTAGGLGYPFEIINPYSVNRQGTDVYSENPSHLREVEAYIWARPDRDRIHVEVLSLTRYIPSAEEHQNHLDKLPNDYCHIPRAHIKKHLQKQPRNGSLREMLNACKTARLKPHPGIDSRKHQLPPIKASQKVAKNQ